MDKKIRNHKDLKVWNKSVDLVDNIYRITESFPNKEIYGLTNQIRRSAVSVPSNIAEGAARSSKKEFIKFLYIALGSLAELETQIIIASRLGYLNDLDSLLNAVKLIQKLLNGLIYSLKR
ncbi:MAG: four helix bundle protein [Candidatus Caldatribacteriota bacterium]